MGSCGQAHLLRTAVNTEGVMKQATMSETSRSQVATQDVALHMITAAAKILLMLGTAILIGEVATGPARKLLDARSNHRRSVNEDGEPSD